MDFYKKYFSFLSEPELLKTDSAEAKKFYFLHISICSIGFIGLLYFICYIVSTRLIDDFPPRFNEGVKEFYFSGKPYELFAYAGTVAGLFIYYFTAYFVFPRKLFTDNLFFNKVLSRKYGLLIYILSAFSINIFLLFLPWRLAAKISDVAHAKAILVGSLGPSSLLWLIVFCCVFWNIIQPKGSFLKRKFVYGCIILATVQMVAMIAPFVFGKLQMMNEYLDIPEQTILKDKTVDNHEYINGHKLFSLQKYNPEKGLISDEDTVSVKLPYSENLREFIQNESFNENVRYGYDARTGTLTFTGTMSDEDFRQLQDVVGKEHMGLLLKMKYDSEKRTRYSEYKCYSKEEKLFLKKNSFEILWQIQNRWVISHVSFILIPAMEYSLGKPWNKIFAQYGLPNSVLVGKLMEMLGGINYQNYFKVWYSFYLIYYALFLVVLFVIFRKSHYVAIAWLLVATVLGFVEYSYLLLGPGLSPLRHFFDIFIILFLYFYFNKKNMGFLLAAAVVAVLSVFNNAQTGLFCLAALSATVGIKFLRQSTDRRIIEILIIIVMAAAGLFAFIWTKHCYDPVTKYYTDGLLGFPVSREFVLFIICCFSLGYFVLLKNMSNWGRDDYISMFLLFLSQGTMIYFIWGGTNAHFLNMASIYIITAIKLLDTAFAHKNSNTKSQTVLVSGIIIFSLVMFTASLFVFYSSKHTYKKNFVDHKTYEWNLDTAKFESTMDPKCFYQAVDLIKKYAKDEPAIYIISKYDHFVTCLSKKYSAMPLFDLQWLLLTGKETEMTIDVVKKAKPEYLFVDTDIERSKNTEIMNQDAPVVGSLHNESIWRVKRLNELNFVYKAVKDEYEAVEKGWLITVYKRKPLTQ